MRATKLLDNVIATLAVIAVSAVCNGCRPGPLEPVSDYLLEEDAAEPGTLLETRTLSEFAFGIEYSEPSLSWVGSDYSTATVNWTKFSGNVGTTRWQDIEPAPPISGNHQYEFAALDTAVVDWQQAGFSNIVMVLRSDNDWATECGGEVPDDCEPSSTLSLYHPSSPPLDEEHWGYYSQFVQAVVERYDGDGVDDAPGLLAPVRWWEIESEAQHNSFWTITCSGCSAAGRNTQRAEQYLRLLEAAREAALAADSEARIILSGMWLYNLVDRGPLSDEQVESALGVFSRTLFADFASKQMPFNQAILAATDLYDAVEFHQLSHYTGVEGSIRWLRDRMGPSGENKQIFVGDALSGPTVIPFPEIVHAREYPDSEDIFEVLTRQEDDYGYVYTELEEWLRAEQARSTAKQTLMAIGSGAAGINLFSWADAPDRIALPGAAKTWAIQGLRDAEHQALKVVSIEDPRPALIAYQYIADLLEGVSLAERIALKSGVRAYRFHVPSGFVWAIWLKEPIARQPGRAAPSTTVRVPLPTGRHWMSILPSLRGVEVETIRVNGSNNGAEIDVTDMPVLIEEGS